MPRLTKQQPKQHRADFETWHSPQALLKKVDEINDSMSGDDFFNQPGLTFVREAWAASKFALERKVDNVRLAQGEFPDFELRIGTSIETVGVHRS